MSPDDTGASGTPCVPGALPPSTRWLVTCWYPPAPGRPFTEADVGTMEALLGPLGVAPAPSLSPRGQLEVSVTVGAATAVDAAQSGEQVITRAAWDLEMPWQAVRIVAQTSEEARARTAWEDQQV